MSTAQRIFFVLFCKEENAVRKKYDDETLEKIFYYYSLAGNRVLTAAQAAECLNLSESSLFRVIADFRESITKEKEEELIKKYQNIDIHSVLNIKESSKSHSSEKSILEDIAITLAEILASVNELKQYIMEKDNTEFYHEDSFLKEETDEIEEPAWEELEELIANNDIKEQQNEIIKETEQQEIEDIEEIEDIQKNEVNTEPKVRQHETIWKGDTEPTLEELERELAKLDEKETEPSISNKAIAQTEQKKEEHQIKSKLDDVAVMCITQLNRMCKEINDLVPRQNMEKMWNDWERICRGYGSQINPIYQRIWKLIKKKAKKEVTEDTIKIICDAQVEQMELELKAVSSQEAIKNISYTYYNWVRQVFEMCYLVQEPMTQEKTKALYTTYLTTLKNVSSHKIEQMHQK